MQNYNNIKIKVGKLILSLSTSVAVNIYYGRYWQDSEPMLSTFFFVQQAVSLDKRICRYKRHWAMLKPSI